MGYSLDKMTDANKEILFDFLKKEGVEQVTVEFDGGGDDGQIDGSDLPDKVSKIVIKGSKVSQGTIYSKDGPTRQWKNDCTVGEIVDGICYEILESLYGGWENNDGAFGNFIFNVKKRSVSLEFNERYTESKLYEHEF